MEVQDSEMIGKVSLVIMLWGPAAPAQPLVQLTPGAFFLATHYHRHLH